MSNNDGSELDKSSAFQTLQATFTPSRRARPPPIDDLEENGDASRIPLKAGRLQRTGSKGGLRAMFTRNKLEKDAMCAVLEEPLPGRRPSEARTIAGHSLHRNDSVKKVAEPTPITPAKSASRVPRMNLRSKSVKENSQTGKPTPRPTKPTAKPVIPRSPAAWDPPPLFQAYPQAIKHAQLSASILSADSIIRISNHKRNNSLNGSPQGRKNSSSGQDQTAAKKTVKARNRHRRQMSGSISKADWTQKIYVLVTSGYLLQYAGDGPFDRLPEKILQLGKDSVAFASDVIPGKHWVLQISQSMDADGMPIADSRSLLSRLTFRGAEYRRTATSFLLVLNSAEEMDSWIAIVRREIESLGGKKQLSETGKQRPDDKVLLLQAQPSHRYLAQKNSGQFSNPSSPTNPCFGSPPWKVEIEAEGRLEDPNVPSFPSPLSAKLLAQHQTIPSSIMYHDARQRENLRENANRLSYMSSGQRTLVTSQHSSATSSPTRESMTTYDEVSSMVSNEELRPRPNARIVAERRRSMQTLRIQTLESLPKNFRHSTYGVPNGSPKSYQFPKPNFIRVSPSTKRLPSEEPPPVPALVSNARSKSMRKGARKGPPTALDVSRPRSAGSGSLSPKSAPSVFVSTNSSFKILQQGKPCIINVPARSNPPTPVEPIYPERRSSLNPNCQEQTPGIRRNASMLALQAATSTILQAPSRPPPLPPQALVVPLPLSPTNTHDMKAEIEAAIDAAQRTISPERLKLRRPVSMQNSYHGIPSPADSHSPLPKSPKSTKSSKSPRSSPRRAYFPPSVKDSGNYTHGLLSPGSQRLTPQNNIALANRRSMPMLVGPPPMPPPNCALPPLPPGMVPRSAVVSRGSVRTQG